jgi:outer membrane protein assembly factor BamB
MKTRLLPILLIILICACCNKPAVDDKQVVKSDSIAIKTFSPDKIIVDRTALQEARIVKGDVFQPEEFLIALSDDTIQANYSGHLSAGDVNKNIDFDKYFYTRKIHYLESGKRIIIFFEITNDDGSYNTVYCLNKNDLSTVWQTKLFSFNLTVGRAENHTLYLGAGENAYALDIETGKLLWQTDGLYHEHGFNFFDSIEITDQTILLTGKSFSKDHGGRMMTLLLDKRDGGILSVK